MYIAEQIKNVVGNGHKFSDVHIRQGKPLQIHVAAGIASVQPDRVVETEDIVEFLNKYLKLDSGKKWEDKLYEAGGQIDFPATVDHVRFRCNLHWFGGKQLGLVMRQINTVVPALHELGLPDTIKRLVETTKGLLLVTGATGSGKSTTLAALVQEINRRRSVNIVTIEDPVEYLFDDIKAKVVQRSVGIDADTRSFSEALRAAMRQDPDVIVVGEMRDHDTAANALQAAETGHLVLATLHTVNAAGTINRLLSMFPADARDQARETLASVLIGVVSQCLLTKKDGSGRTLGYEIMLNSQSIASLIRKGELQQLKNAIQQGAQEGMVLLNARLRSLVDSQTVTLEEALRHAYDKKDGQLESM